MSDTRYYDAYEARRNGLSNGVVTTSSYIPGSSSIIINTGLSANLSGVTVTSSGICTILNKYRLIKEYKDDKLVDVHLEILSPYNSTWECSEVIIKHV